MVLAPLHPAHSYYINVLQFIPRKYQKGRNTREFTLLFTIWLMWWLLNCLKSSIRSQSTILGSRGKWNLRILSIHTQFVAICTPKLPKMAAKSESLPFYLLPRPLNGCSAVLNPLLYPNQLFLGSGWHWHLRILPIHAKIVAIFAPTCPKWPQH